jgi:hypothetical protein
MYPVPLHVLDNCFLVERERGGEASCIVSHTAKRKTQTRFSYVYREENMGRMMKRDVRTREKMK